MNTPTPMQAFQDCVQELSKAWKSITKAINRAFKPIIRIFVALYRRLQLSGIIERKAHAHKHRQSTRRMQVYAARSL